MSKGDRCSFYGKHQALVSKLIAGPNGVFICDCCVEVCVSGKVRKNHCQRRSGNVSSLNVLGFRRSKKMLDDYVIGQEYAKKVRQNCTVSYRQEGAGL